MSRPWPFPPLASEHGAQVDDAMLLVFGMIGALFLGWLIFYFVILHRFRASRHPVAVRNGNKSAVALLGVVAAVAGELVLLVGLSLPFWQERIVALPGPDQSPITVRVVGQQFAWNFHYPGADGAFGKGDPAKVDEVDNPLGLDPDDPASADDIVTRNQLYLPLGRPVIVQVSSKDVIHSFSLPDFRVKQDAVPGMVNTVSFVPTMTTEAYAQLKGEGRTFEVVCAQLCGQGHYTMRGFVTVVTEEAFQAWLVEKAPKPKSAEEEFWEN